MFQKEMEQYLHFHPFTSTSMPPFVSSLSTYVECAAQNGSFCFGITPILVAKYSVRLRPELSGSPRDSKGKDLML